VTATRIDRRARLGQVLQRTAWWIAATATRLGDRINPILVKETRQALKSRQFSVSFGLVLLSCWLWSIGGTAMIGPSVYYRASGSELFYGYFLILAFPLAVVVPFFAYRSLSAEAEENTYELLSITTLSPRQIVAGKLGSAVVQMAIYLSAVAPCLAFTYLLRGIDVVSIGVLLVAVFLASLGLSMIGLMLATTTRERYMQVVLSVGLILGLFWSFVGGMVAAGEFVWEGARYVRDRDFWIGVAALVTAYATYFVLFFLAAVARLTFNTENRSTPLRIAMLGQFACFAGWMAVAWIESRGMREVVEVFLIITAVNWYAMGVLMTGESPIVSDRVQRHLPRTWLGRVLLTWFNPGPGTGYMFAIASLLGAVLLAGIAAMPGTVVGFLGPSGRQPTASTIVLAILLVSYLTLFLGLGKLAIAAARHFAPIGLLRATAIHLSLLGVAVAIPMAIQFSSVHGRLMGYTALQMSNPFWTLAELFDRRSLHPDTALLVVVIPVLATLAWLGNARSIITEVRYVRVTPPKRIIEEDAILTPAPQHAKTSPWD
jgi:hypothetical protein